MTGAGTADQRMLNPNGALQAVTPRRVSARTCAKSEYGLPVIQGSEIGTETAGLFSPLLDQTMPLSEKFLLVESSKRYVTAPATGFQANDGVREKVCTTGSFARKREGVQALRSAVGGQGRAGRRGNRERGNERSSKTGADHQQKLSAPALRAQSLVRVTSTE